MHCGEDIIAMVLDVYVYASGNAEELLHGFSILN